MSEDDVAYNLRWFASDWITKVRAKEPDSEFWLLDEESTELDNLFEDAIPDEPITEVWRAHRDKAYLFPPFARQLNLLLERCHEAGLSIYLFEGRRSFRRQAYLYEQGRKRRFDRNGDRLPIVTNADAGYSYHQYGIAADFVFDRDQYRPGMQWTWQGDYEKFGEIVADFSLLEWGGNWQHFKEYPHVQMPLGYSIQQIKSFYDRHRHKGRSKAMNAVWKMLWANSRKRFLDDNQFA